MKLLVVNYHYYRDETYKSGIYPTSKKQLFRQIDSIRKHNYEFTSLNDITNIYLNGNKTNQKLCLITFDDGLKEQVKAYDDLCLIGIPAQFYACSAPFLDNSIIDVHKIHLIRTKLDDKQLFKAIQDYSPIDKYQFNEDFLKAQYRYDSLLSSKVKYYLNFVIDFEKKEKILNNLTIDIFGNLNDIIKSLYMSESDMLKIDKTNQLGCHGHSHRPLGSLSFKEAEDQLRLNVNYLRQIGCKNINSFTFPYGGPSAIREDMNHIFDQHGIKTAFSMKRELNSLNNNPLLLNRFDTNDIFHGKNEDKFKEIIA